VIEIKPGKTTAIIVEGRIEAAANDRTLLAIVDEHNIRWYPTPSEMRIEEPNRTCAARTLGIRLVLRDGRS